MPLGQNSAVFRSLLGIGALLILFISSTVPVAAGRAGFSHSSGMHPAALDQGRLTGPSSRPASLATAYNGRGLQKEVFGFAPYWALSQYTSWDYSLMSTVAYFGVTVKWDGTFDTSDAGWAGFNSQNMVNMVNQAHQAGDRVVLVIKGSGTAAVNDVVTIPSETQAVITSTIGAIGFRNLDGVNVDFEGNTDPAYPNIQAGLTNFMTQMSAQVHQQRPGSFVSIDTYTGSASWDGGLMNITALAPVVDAMFIMAYDMSFANMPGQAGPNAPMTGWTYNDTTSISQYLTKAPASKIILGVPWYGYKFNTTSNAPYGVATSSIAASYTADMREIACAPGVSQSVDGPSQSPVAIWYSPATGDPCGDNQGSWQELYYDNTQSLGVKYDLVNRTGIRGMGIWALGYDGGAPELWSELSTYFSCPVTVTGPTSVTTSQFSVGVSAGSCSVASFDVEQYDSTLGHGWYPISATSPAAGAATASARGFPGYTYQIRARAHSTAGVVSAWSTATVAVPTTATFSGAFKGLYTMDSYGGIHADDSPPLTTGSYWPGWKIAHTAKALPGPMPDSGAVLDGYGGLHPYGAAFTINSNTSWPGWDIARDFAFLPDGSGGYLLDGYGGLHPFSVNGHALPPAADTSANWPGWDIARRVVIFSDGTGGYVMDGYGGLHPFGIGAPPPAAATGGAYWSGWTIARDVVLVPGTHAGYVLDGYGGIHPFSGAPALSSSASWPGWDIARALWLVPGSTSTAASGYILDGYGGLHPLGGAPALSSFGYWPGLDLARSVTGF